MMERRRLRVHCAPSISSDKTSDPTVCHKTATTEIFALLHVLLVLLVLLFIIILSIERLVLCVSWAPSNFFLPAPLGEKATKRGDAQLLDSS